jgi:uncharacterized protein YhbP (UPF0306 family)
MTYNKNMDIDVESVIREYIDKSLHMSIATVRDDSPWVCEVHFVYDDALNLYWRSLPSRRHSQELGDNPNISGNIVCQHGLNEIPHGIYFEGKARILDSDEEINQLLPLFRERLGVPEEKLAEVRQPDGHKIYKVSVRKWYAFGKFSGEKVAKYELEWK